MDFPDLGLFSLYQLMHHLPAVEWGNDSMGTGQWKWSDLFLFLDDAGEFSVWNLWVQLTLKVKLIKTHLDAKYSILYIIYIHNPSSTTLPP